MTAPGRVGDEPGGSAPAGTLLRRHVLQGLMVATGLALAGCGGSGGSGESGGSPADPPAPNPPPAGGGTPPAPPPDPGNPTTKSAKRGIAYDLPNEQDLAALAPGVS